MLIEDWVLLVCLAIIIILFFFMISTIRSLVIESKWMADKNKAYAERIQRLTNTIKELKKQINEEL